MVGDGAFSHKRDYIFTRLKIPKGIKIAFTTGWQVIEILLSGWILPIGGDASRVSTEPKGVTEFFWILKKTE